MAPKESRTCNRTTGQNWPCQKSVSDSQIFCHLHQEQTPLNSSLANSAPPVAPPDSAKTSWQTATSTRPSTPPSHSAGRPGRDDTIITQFKGMEERVEYTTQKIHYYLRKIFTKYFKKPNQYSLKMPLPLSSAVSETFVGIISTLKLPIFNKRISKALSQISLLWKKNI